MWGKVGMKFSQALYKNINFDKILSLRLMQNIENKDFIDIDEVFRTKNPRLYSYIPGFILSYLKKIVHQKDINLFIKRNSDKSEFEFVEAIIKEFGAHVEVSGLENIPKTGGFIVAANHPLGGLDALAMIDKIGTIRKDILFVVNDILLQIKNLKGIFVGVNKHGKNSALVFKTLDSLYASGKGVLIFPAGMVSRKKSNKIRDLDWKKSFIINARKNNLPIVPAFIKGQNSTFFYNLSNFRSMIGIKLNIEMLYLADEMYRQKNRTISITFGQPIAGSTFNEELTDFEWAQLFKEHIYNLEKNGPFTTFDKDQLINAAHN